MRCGAVLMKSAMLIFFSWDRMKLSPTIRLPNLVPRGKVARASEKVDRTSRPCPHFLYRTMSFFPPLNTSSPTMHMRKCRHVSPQLKLREVFSDLRAVSSRCSETLILAWQPSISGERFSTIRSSRLFNPSIISLPFSSSSM